MNMNELLNNCLCTDPDVKCAFFYFTDMVAALYNYFFTSSKKYIELIDLIKSNELIRNKPLNDILSTNPFKDYYATSSLIELINLLDLMGYKRA